MKKSKILKTTSTVAAVVAVATLSFSLLLNFRAMIKSHQACKEFRNTPEYEVLLTQKRDDLTTQLKNGEITAQESAEEMKNFASDSNVTNLIKSGNNQTSKELITSSETSAYVSIGSIAVFTLSAYAYAVAKNGQHELAEKESSTEKEA